MSKISTPAVPAPIQPSPLVMTQLPVPRNVSVYIPNSPATSSQQLLGPASSQSSGKYQNIM